MQIGLSYDDVYIIPQYSSVTSRSEIDTSIRIGDLKLDVPIISANMDSISGWKMCVAMWESGAIGALHRFLSVEMNVHLYKTVKAYNSECFVSIGVSGDSRERAWTLYKAGARYFIVDIAHGHSQMMRDTICWLKETFPDAYIMGGNIATENGARALSRWGADAVKAGIGNGSVCTTRDVTGVNIPQLTSIQEAVKGSGHKPVIADGGIRQAGDIVKAIGMGASLVMCGRLFAGCPETPLPAVGNKKMFRGMASRKAMSSAKEQGCIRNREADRLPTPEGTSMWVELKSEKASHIVEQVKGGLQSAFSYSNARNITEFQDKVVFGQRK